MAAVESAGDRAWYIAQRWQQFEGEARANLLRIAAIGAFYLLHLWNYYSSQGKLPNWGLLELSEAGSVGQRFHVLATLLAMTWVLGAAAVLLCLRNRVFPRWISTASTALDLVMLTSVLCISNGPRSPVTVGYFLIIAIAGLRFSVPLVRMTTVGAALGYLCVLGVAKWPERFGRDAAIDLRVPRYEQLVMLTAIVLCGVIVGQVVRQARRIAEDAQRAGGHREVRG
jgi:hypothetical protein